MYAAAATTPPSPPKYSRPLAPISLPILAQAGETSGGDYLRREDFEHWLEMGERPTPVQERLFEVFVVTPGDAQVIVANLIVF